MRKIFILMLLLTALSEAGAQVIYDARVDSVVNRVSQPIITKNLKELTGDTVTFISGIRTLIFSRYYNSPAKRWAAQFIYQKLQSYGYSPQFQTIDSLCTNVIAIKTGTKYPNQKYVLGAHYDNILSPYPPLPYDTVYGADDNGTGVCGVLETARLLAGINLEYTIVFAFWDNEEDGPGLRQGSSSYSDSAKAHGDSIKAYLNLDMFGWNKNSANQYTIETDSNSVFLSDIYNHFRGIYMPAFRQYFYYERNLSDNHSFAVNQYSTLDLCEDDPFSNPNFHNITDIVSNVNMNYYIPLLKTVIAVFTSLSLDKTAFFSHKPISSSSETAPRIATAVIRMPGLSINGASTPRLYFNDNNNAYSYRTAFYNHADTFKFQIPGFPKGTTVKYYFAAQNESGSFVCTYPIGGSGANPPGTNPPPSYYYYEVFRDGNFCSSTLPKPITDNHSTADTITLNETGFIVKTTVSLSLIHSNDGDLILQLLKPGIATINLSQRNGQGGQNYTNTIFDDAAAISITQGTPPFTGSFKPQNVLNYLADEPVSGKYIFKVTDVAAGNQGSLANWCITLQYKHTVGVNEEIVPSKYSLSQNYPNPFNSATRISYSIPKNSDVNLKVYDMLGREVRTLASGYQSAGDYIVIFNSGDLSSGVYFYRLTAGEYSDIKRMVVIK